MALTAAAQAAKDHFIRVRGTWGDSWETMAALTPEFVSAYADFSAVAWQKSALEPKVKEFIYIAADASATHMFIPGVRQHVAAALAHGATTAEIVGVLEIVSTIGVHSPQLGLQVLYEELAEAGIEAQVTPPDRQGVLRERFIELHGMWGPMWDSFLRLDGDLFESFIELAAIPVRRNDLSPSIRELVAIALCAAPTHLQLPALREHIRAALRLGVSQQEIVEVFDIVSVIGVHAMSVSAPIIAEQA